MKASFLVICFVVHTTFVLVACNCRLYQIYSTQMKNLIYDVPNPIMNTFMNALGTQPNC